jgi:hypothetical protein
VPDAEISGYAATDAFLQPCAVRAQVRSDLTVDIELVPAGSSGPDLRPRTAAGLPEFSGAVFERTVDGRQPVPGVDVWAENFADTPIARTRTDVDGRLFMCNLPDSLVVWLTKPGFVTWHGTVDTRGAPFEVELKRGS